MIKDLHLQEVSILNSLIQAKKIEYKEILKSCYTAIHQSEPEIHAWEFIVPEKSLRTPVSTGPLFGLCLGIKDIFATVEAPTKMGVDENTWRGTQGQFDARVVSKVRAAGATIVGKNKTSEFAVHEPTDTVNPRNPLLAPGTSSSGGAAAVAAGHVSVVIASQTAGSIARPSSYCGVIGFKPTYGELPRTGVLKTTESFDTVGIIGNSISNIWATFEAARVHDLNHPIHLKRSGSTPEKFRVLFAIGDVFDEADTATRNSAISLALEATGEKVPKSVATETKLNFKDLRTCHEDIYAKELSYFLRNELEFGNISEGLKQFGAYGKTLSNEVYRERLCFLNEQKGLADSQLSDAILISLSASSEAPKIGANDLIDANLFWTSLGLPQITLPLLWSESGNPIGLSIVGPRGSDSKLLELAKKFFSSVR
jgi:Asp-tRNA(Asn)/Glu-tRNA(Gln) amidotransferase A subunit family amidase